LLSEQNQEKRKEIQKTIWDNGIIAEFMSRPDTLLTFIESRKYKLYVWVEITVDYKIILEEAGFCFRILAFLGAPDGFVVNWWRIDKPRILKPNEFPTRAEINGGWAYRGQPAVWIYRLEEWDRVLIHECVHALNWDVNPTAEVKTCLENITGGTFSDALFEAATEFNAEWFWCLIHAPESDKTGVTWERQKRWQLNQAYKIIARNAGKKWEEDTSVFAYYVLKAALAANDFEFLLNWYSSVENPERWCDVWIKNKSAFYNEANKLAHTNNQTIIMRMTDPDLE